MPEYKREIRTMVNHFPDFKSLRVELKNCHFDLSTYNNCGNTLTNISIFDTDKKEIEGIINSLKTALDLWPNE